MALFKPLNPKLRHGRYVKLLIDGVWACDEDGVPLLHRNRNSKVMFTDWEGRRWKRIKSKKALDEYKRHQGKFEKAKGNKKAKSSKENYLL